MKVTTTTAAWTLALALVIWYVNYEFVTPGVSLTGQEASFVLVISLLAVLGARWMYGKVRARRKPAR